MQEGGADAVKIEGGRDVADDIEKLVATEYPYLGILDCFLKHQSDWRLS